jgi:hypothetical protein
VTLVIQKYFGEKFPDTAPVLLLSTARSALLEFDVAHQCHVAQVIHVVIHRSKYIPTTLDMISEKLIAVSSRGSKINPPPYSRSHPFVYF